MGQYKPADGRYSTRRPLRLDVAVYNDCRLAPLHFESRDLSLGGISLDTGAVALPLNAYVVLVIRARTGEEEAIDLRLPALVVRTFEDGAGLMFQDYEPQILQTLREMLHRERAEAPRDRPDPRAFLL